MHSSTQSSTQSSMATRHRQRSITVVPVSQTQLAPLQDEEQLFPSFTIPTAPRSALKHRPRQKIVPIEEQLQADDGPSNKNTKRKRKRQSSRRLSDFLCDVQAVFEAVLSDEDDEDLPADLADLLEDDPNYHPWLDDICLHYFLQNEKNERRARLGQPSPVKPDTSLPFQGLFGVGADGELCVGKQGQQLGITPADLACLRGGPGSSSSSSRDTAQLATKIGTWSAPQSAALEEDDDELLEALTATHKAAKSRRSSALHREAISKGMKDAWQRSDSKLGSAEHRANLGKSSKDAWQRPDSKLGSAEHMANKSKGTKDAWQRPDSKLGSAEHRANLSKGTKDAWQRPDSKLGSAEHRANKSKGTKDAWQRPDSKLGSAEHRANMSTTRTIKATLAAAPHTRVREPGKRQSKPSQSMKDNMAMAELLQH